MASSGLRWAAGGVKQGLHRIFHQGDDSKYSQDGPQEHVQALDSRHQQAKGMRAALPQPAPADNDQCGKDPHRQDERGGEQGLI